MAGVTHLLPVEAVVDDEHGLSLAVSPGRHHRQVVADTLVEAQLVQPPVGRSQLQPRRPVGAQPQPVNTRRRVGGGGCTLELCLINVMVVQLWDIYGMRVTDTGIYTQTNRSGENVRKEVVKN